jgi:hypothetical protein
MKAILKSLAVLLSLGALVFIASCSHPIEIVGDGDVTSASATRDCTLEEFQAGEDSCSKNYVLGEYIETYYALPRAGWQFHRWINCIGAVDNTCSLNVPADIVQQFWGQTVPPLRAVFIDPVIVDGKEWLQPDLFTGYTWEEINAVCPAGICSGALPGSPINLTGYTLASLEDMNALFNYFIESATPEAPILGPGPDREVLPLEVFTTFGEAGWRSWVIDDYCDRGGCYTLIGVRGRISEEGGALSLTASMYLASSCSLGFCGAATIAATDGASPGTVIGAWLYREL